MVKLSRKSRDFLKGLISKGLLREIRKIKKINVRLNALEENQKILLKNQYKDLDNNKGKPKINNYEFKIHSQNGEDGLLLYIFSRIGTTNRKFVEFGVEDGRECNAANLVINFGWSGLLIEGNRDFVSEAVAFYKSIPSIEPFQVKIIHCFVRKDNINAALSKHGFKGEIDLLSIDIDGNDYWIWKEVDVINPRVVVIEYNAFLGYDRSITVKYDSSFNRYEKHSGGRYFGASLGALTKLAKTKGYLLVGCDSHGINAFFVRKDVIKKKLPELSVKEAYFPRRDLGMEGTVAQFAQIRHLGFEQV